MVGTAVARTLLLISVGVAGCNPPAGATIPVPVRDLSLARDPINAVHIPSLRTNAERVLRELVAALPADQRARVASIALVSDNGLGDVNAYATCDTGGPFIAISDGMLMVAAHLANTTATDEFFGTELDVRYLDWLENHSIAPPPPAFYATDYQTDRRKVLRQHELFDEEIAFVLAHELAHHYLGHLACNSDGGVVEEVGQIASDSVPLFNQTTEVAADVAGVKNVLAAGVARTGYTWTEDGALLVIAAFNRRHPLTAEDVLFGFERSHPIPHVRVPIITSTAELWHNSGGHLPL
ncbi:hypothetical protein BH11MYX3_BH11MYX3_35790 [soil metagenome]